MQFHRTMMTRETRSWGQRKSYCWMCFVCMGWKAQPVGDGHDAPPGSVPGTRDGPRRGPTGGA